MGDSSPLRHFTSSPRCLWWLSKPPNCVSKSTFISTKNCIFILMLSTIKTRKDFQDFADLLFSQFGDRVKHWVTINEPWGLSYLGYTLGVFAPGRCSSWIDGSCTGGDSATEPYEITHNQLLSHAAVVKLYRDKYQVLLLLYYYIEI